MRDLNRRGVIGLVSGAAAWPLAARAQRPAKAPLIGMLVPGSRATHGEWFAALAQRLRELGWIEGRTITFEYRFAEGRTDRAADIAAEFVRLPVDTIVTSASLPTLAAREATAKIPIVSAGVADAVGSGIVASLARPGGNVTGISVLFTDLAGKRLELLREVAPQIRRLGILTNTDNPGAVLEIRAVQEISRPLGLEVVAPDVRHPEDILAAFDTFKGRIDALYVIADPLLTAHRSRINTLTLQARLPSMHSLREWVEAGGLMSYGPNMPTVFRRAGEFVDKILRGTRPEDIPVEQPTKFDLAINITTAKALGVTVPDRLVILADQAIE